MAGIHQETEPLLAPPPKETYVQVEANPTNKHNKKNKYTIGCSNAWKYSAKKVLCGFSRLCYLIAFIIALVAVLVVLVFAVWPALYTCDVDLALPRDAALCNRDAALCDRRVSDVTFACLHNAYASRADNFGLPQHDECFRKALVAGARALMLDVHLKEDGTLALCHARCIAGQETPLPVVLGYINDFLELNPNEIVIIVWETGYDGRANTTNADRIALKTRMDEAYAVHLAARSYFRSSAESTAPWPTLRQLRDDGTTLLSFTDSASLPGTMWDMQAYGAGGHLFDTTYNTPLAESLAEDCSLVGRGRPHPNRLFIVNHFTHFGALGVDLTRVRILGIDLETATGIDLMQALGIDVLSYNTDPFFTERITACGECHGYAPNLIAVDFWNNSDVLALTMRLNSLSVRQRRERFARNASACPSNATVWSV